jgi:pimeloyl-ACP methyl ester carboxylesterase
MTTNTNTASTTTHHVELPDGRVLAVQETGPADGPVVVFIPAVPGSRAFDPDPSATAEAGIRLLTVDRAGYGESSPLEGVAPSEASGADDVAFAVRHLGVEAAAFVGWSNGGAYVLAVAARHPDLVRSAALVGTPARHADVPWLTDEQAGMVPMMQQDPIGAVATLQQIFAGTGDDVEGRRGLVAQGPVDEALLAGDDELRARFDGMLDEAFRNGMAGVATDIVATSVVAPGYDPAAIGAPVHLFYGEADDMVGPEHGRHWDGVLADSTLHLVPGVGHLVVVTDWVEVLDAVS